MSEHTIEHQARAAVGLSPGVVPASSRTPAAIADSIAFADDRLDRVASSLNDLDSLVERLTERLASAMTDGRPESYPQASDAMTSPPSPEDRRSAIARRVAELGSRADSQADRVQSITRSIGAILDALEV